MFSTEKFFLKIQKRQTVELVSTLIPLQNPFCAKLQTELFDSWSQSKEIYLNY